MLEGATDRAPYSRPLGKVLYPQASGLKPCADFAVNVPTLYNVTMNAALTIPIESLSTEEKILLMERLWDDLSRRPSSVPTPDWHGDVLAKRLAAVREGRTSFVDWDAAKERLRERLK